MNHLFQCSIFLFALLTLLANSLFAIDLENCKDCVINIALEDYPDKEDIQDSNFKQHYSMPCFDILEYKGYNWALIVTVTYALDNFFFEKKSHRLSGLAGRYKLQDSTLYLTGLDICFDSQDDGFYPDGKFHTKVPLDLLVPGAKDSIVASFVTDYMKYICLDCQTNGDSKNLVNMEISFKRGKISHKAFVSNSPINPITKEYFPLCVGSFNGKFWYLDNKKEYDLLQEDFYRHAKKWDHFYKYPLDTIQFKDLIDSLSPYYQKHRRNYLDSLAKEKEKQSSEKKKDGQ